MKLTERFAALDENLKLDPAERTRAQEVHNAISDLLIAAGIARRTRLQGSFARKTMLPPLHDIDKVIELADDLLELLSTADGPRKVMEMIRAAIMAEMPTAQFEAKKHALGIVLPDDGFDFDAVPAFNPEDGSGWIRIANTQAVRGEDAWRLSNTYQLIDTIAEHNQHCGGRFVRQVRMVKQIVHIAGIADTLPGLHVETFAYFAITEEMEHPTAIAATLTRAFELLGGPYSEPTGADRISDRLQPHQVARARTTLASLSAKAAEALVLAVGGNETGAAHIWADLFGGLFPRPSDAEERSYLRTLHAGTAAAALTAKPAPPTRAWQP